MSSKVVVFLENAILPRFLPLITSLLVPLMFSCSRNKSEIIVAGSTSVQPFIEKLADQFVEKHPGIKINVQGGGSTAGIQATANKTCNIGTSSRYLEEKEKGLKVYLMALDGIAIIVHKNNQVDNLTTEKIKDIFEGKITNWQEVGGNDSKIIPVTREEGSGTRGTFEKLIMGDKTISDACLVQDSNGAVREIIATTPQGIGYISAGLVDERIKALKIDGIYPSFENLISNKYQLIRPFLLLTNSGSTECGHAKEFIDYILSPEAQKTLKSDGLVPVQEMSKDEVL
jgi:phosphate transport system substrate-binding protein